MGGWDEKGDIYRSSFSHLDAARSIVQPPQVLLARMAGQDALFLRPALAIGWG
jgi:hypothetical protein